MVDELYAEIDTILPSLQYCLAPQKAKVSKAGSSSLRSGIRESSDQAQKETSQLDVHAKILYEWLDKSKVSRIRMLLTWQSAGGLSYVASVHHRAAQCFRYHGNTLHNKVQQDDVSRSFRLVSKVGMLLVAMVWSCMTST